MPLKSTLLVVSDVEQVSSKQDQHAEHMEAAEIKGWR